MAIRVMWGFRRYVDETLEGAKNPKKSSSLGLTPQKLQWILSPSFKSTNKVRNFRIPMVSLKSEGGMH